MNRQQRGAHSRWLFRAILAATVLPLRPATSWADPSPAPAASNTAGAGDAPPDESLLGTVEVNGSAGGLLPLPRMAVVPIVTAGSADSIVNLVVRRDMTLSGQFEVLDPSAAPSGPFTHTTLLDLASFRSHGAEYVLRVFAQPAATDSAKTELVGEAYLTPASGAIDDAGAQRLTTAAAGTAERPGVEPKPAFRTVLPTSTLEVRAASHRLVDRLLGALTGRPGGFASEMAYAEKVGRWRRVYALDSDGFDLRAVGPIDATALSPAFGPGGQIFYALSRNYSPFQLVFGSDATVVPIAIPGSVLGLAFNSDRSRVALIAMEEGRSQLWIGDRGRPTPMETPPLANHPVFGPLGKVAYTAGTPVQRVYVDGKAVSPPGFMASAPVFCDTPQGLLVVYTVGTGAGADIIATDANGGSLRRLTQHEGANTYAACSPDGRLIAFFSTGKRKVDARASEEGGRGLFVMPIQRPWLAKKISDEVGESLRWEPL